MVEFVVQNVKRYSYRLSDLKIEVLDEEFVVKTEEPQLIPVGRSRVCFLDSVAQLRVVYIVSRSLIAVVLFSFL